MNDSDIATRLDAIEKRLESLGERKKDIWDRIGTVLPVLVPAAIALAGYLISEGIKRSEVAVAETNARVSQAQLISGFMNNLTGDSPLERALAIDAILIAIPEHGAALARAVAETDTSAAVRRSAESSLDRRRDQLIVDLFSPASQTRVKAADDLLATWRDDPALIPPLLAFARRNPDNANGIYNTAVILNAVPASSLAAHEDAIRDFLAMAETKGSRTHKVVEQVRARL